MDEYMSELLYTIDLFATTYCITFAISKVTDETRGSWLADKYNIIE